MIRLANFGNYPDVTGKFRDDQIAHMSTWAVVPDDQRLAASMTNITVLPKNGSTETFVNPLDPATPRIGNSPDTGWAYADNDNWGTVVPCGKAF